MACGSDRREKVLAWAANSIAFSRKRLPLMKPRCSSHAPTATERLMQKLQAPSMIVRVFQRKGSQAKGVPRDLTLITILRPLGQEHGNRIIKGNWHCEARGHPQHHAKERLMRDIPCPTPHARYGNPPRPGEESFAEDAARAIALTPGSGESEKSKHDLEYLLTKSLARSPSNSSCANTRACALEISDAISEGSLNKTL